MLKHYKYMRIQGREIAKNTEYANGVFGIFRDLERGEVLSEEDYDLYVEIVEFFINNLPFPPMCNNQEKVVCFFKTESADEMMKYMKPLVWLLERYHHPYDIVLTNFPGEIVYEDEYQVVVEVDKLDYRDTKDVMREDIFEKLMADARNRNAKAQD